MAKQAPKPLEAPDSSYVDLPKIEPPAHEASPHEAPPVVHSAPIALDLPADDLSPVTHRDPPQAGEAVPPPPPQPYVNPDPKVPANQKPRRARPKKASGRYLATEPFEMLVPRKDPITGERSALTRRIEIGQVIAEGCPEETLAGLQAQKLIEPEFVEDE